LKLKVVAEGVESPEQLEFLKALGCDQYQGFHFSPALPAAKFEALVRATSEADPDFTEAEAQRTHSKLAAYRPR
jgi:EAL domain-containing protein (putative c-di-GMP-specific phosphodiesterase class I)